jgi:hypothetical protein
MSDGWGRAKKEDADAIRLREGNVQRRNARRLVKGTKKKKKPRAAKGMTKAQAAKAYEAVAAELDRLQGAASSHISRVDNNWVFERVYSFRYIAERIRREYEVGDYTGGGPHAERLGSKERAELTRLRLAEDDRQRAEHAASNAVAEPFVKNGADTAIEAEIQGAYASEREPAPDDLEGWKRRSGHWQAAWAGAHTRAAQAMAQRDNLRASHEFPRLQDVGDIAELKRQLFLEREEHQRTASLQRVTARTAVENEQRMETAEARVRELEMQLAQRSPA